MQAKATKTKTTRTALETNSRRAQGDARVGLCRQERHSPRMPPLPSPPTPAQAQVDASRRDGRRATSDVRRQRTRAHRPDKHPHSSSPSATPPRPLHLKTTLPPAPSAVLDAPRPPRPLSNASAAQQALARHRQRAKGWLAGARGGHARQRTPSNFQTRYPMRIERTCPEEEAKDG